MADGGVIQEFLVSLGFKIDEGSQQRFADATKGASAGVAKLQAQAQQAAKGLQEFAKGLGENAAPALRKYDEATRKLGARHEELRKGVVELGRAAVVGAAAFAAGILQVTRNYEQLFYAAQQAGTSAENLSKLAFGFQQIGLHGQDALALMQNMALTMKAQPGLQGFLGSLIGPQDVQKLAGNMGTARDQVGAFLALIDKLATMAPAIRNQIAQMFGIPQDVLERAIANREQLRKSYEEYGALLEKAGVNQDQFAKDSRDFMNLLGKIWSEFELIFVQAAIPVVKALTPVLTVIDQLLQALLAFNNAVPGAAIAETFTVMAVGATTLLGAFGLMTRGLGLALGPIRAIISIIGVLSTALEGLGLAMGLLNPAVLVFGGLALLIVTHLDEIKQAWREVSEQFSAGLALLGHNLADAGNRIANALAPIGNVVRAALEPLIGWLHGIVEEIKSVFAWIDSLTPTLPSWLTGRGGAPAPAPQPQQSPAPEAQPGPPRPPAEPGFTPGGAWAPPPADAQPAMPGRAPARYQEGGIVRIDAHDQEMVLPAPISRGLQHLYMGETQRAATGEGDIGGGRERNIFERLGDWLAGAGIIPKVEIDNTDDFAAGVGGIARPGGPGVGAGPAGGAGGAGAGGGPGGGGRLPGAAAPAAAPGEPTSATVQGPPAAAAAPGEPFSARVQGPPAPAPGAPPTPPGTLGGDTSLSGNAFLASQRARFKAELDKSPELKKRLAAVVDLENPAAGTAVVESLMNRMAMSGGTIASGIGGGGKSFYGPVRRGSDVTRQEELERDPKRMAARMKQIDEALAGSNIIQGYTDQGSAGDPNYITGGVGINIANERFNDWGGYKGVETSRAWREAQQAQVARMAEVRAARGEPISPTVQGPPDPRMEAVPQVTPGLGARPGDIARNAPAPFTPSAPTTLPPAGPPAPAAALIRGRPASASELAERGPYQEAAGPEPPPGFLDKAAAKLHSAAEKLNQHGPLIAGGAARLDRLQGPEPLTSSTTNGGDTITHEGDKNVTMNVEHNLSIEGGGSQLDTVGRYSGASKRLYGDMLRDLKGGMLT
jgi:hypothetical protein